MRQAFAKPFGDRIVSGSAPLGAIVSVGTLIFAGLVMLAEQAGLPRSIVYVMAGILLVAGIVVPAWQARTMSPADWMVARRDASLAINTMALGASLVAGWTMAALAGSFFVGSPQAIGWIAGPMLALALASFAIVPFLRKSGAATPTHFINARFASLPVNLSFAAMVLAVGLLLTWSQFRLTGQLAEMLFGIDRTAAIIAATCLTALTVLPGGLRGVLRVNATLFAFLATAFLAPLVWVSVGLGTFPIPQLSFGQGALVEISEIERQLSQLGFDLFTRQVDGLTVASHPVAAALTTSLFLALGLCAMPFVLGHFSASPDTSATRKTTAWTILAVALVLTAAPAVAMFVKLFLYRGTLGLTTGEIDVAASWLFVWSGKHSMLDTHSMASLCGHAVQDVRQAIAACGGDPAYVIGPADIRFSGDAVMLAMTDIFGMPGVFGALVAAAALAGSIALANAVAYSIGANLSGALYKADSTKEHQSLIILFRARLVLLVTLACAGWLATLSSWPPVEIFMWAMAAGAAIVAPVLVASIWWPGMSRNGVLAGIGAGGLVLAFQASMPWLGGESFGGLPALPGLEGLSPAISASIYALIPALAALIAVPLATRKSDGGAMLETLRQPGARQTPPELDI